MCVLSQSFSLLEEFPEISLNAITGTPSPKTMRLIGFLRFQPVVILIDYRSMPNFLDTKLALKLGIQPLQQDEIRVQVANGEELTSPGRCKDVDVKMQGFLFRTELFDLLLAGCDVVLGIHWLRTLGPILWDFTELRMEFNMGEVLVFCMALNKVHKSALMGVLILSFLSKSRRECSFSSWTVLPILCTYTATLPTMRTNKCHL
jgi:hypothetical protein